MMDTHDKENSSSIQFYPPLYIQRYNLALNYLTQHNVRSVIDFGCSDCGLMKLLPTVACLEEVALVDVDSNLLQSKKRMIEPELRHYIHRRHQPLHILLMAGSAEVTDSRLLNYDAVTLIEVIEHLELHVLENVTHNVFGNLAPKLCIVTTPNSEFNVLFNNPDPKQFRHWDHKFEWTRQEFQQWCEQICQNYGYFVEYSGVGEMSSRPDAELLGPCSQAAIFTRWWQREEEEEGTHSQSCLCYELIAESYFPYEKETLSLEERIDCEVSYCLRQMLISRREYVTEDEPVYISITDLAKLCSVKNLCDECAVRDSLRRCNCQLSSDGLYVVLEDDNGIDDDDDGNDDDGWFCDEVDNRCHRITEASVEICHQTSPDITYCDNACDHLAQSDYHTCEEVWDTDLS